MKKQNVTFIENLKGRLNTKGKVESDETRPVKWIQEGKNVWRIVYAD